MIRLFMIYQHVLKAMIQKLKQHGKQLLHIQNGTILITQKLKTMKKQVIDFIRSLGGIASYAGNTEKVIVDPEGNKPEPGEMKNKKGQRLVVTSNKAIMFINDPSGQFDIEHAVLSKFGFGLPFTLKTN